MYDGDAITRSWTPRLNDEGLYSYQVNVWSLDLGFKNLTVLIQVIH
ncbi:MAG: hypothetical protein SGJ04_04800 [Bacteroidota bacterium]|nr:hypothetical protein [Bacteroidota bacterium]